MIWGQSPPHDPEYGTLDIVLDACAGRTQRRQRMEYGTDGGKSKQPNLMDVAWMGFQQSDIYAASSCVQFRWRLSLQPHTAGTLVL